MKLDDRPVIDQLLEPTPLNILQQVACDVAQGVYEEPEWTSAQITAAYTMAAKIFSALEAQL